MQEITLHSLADCPEHVFACAQWEHAEWGAADGKSLDHAIAAYAGARHDTLPMTLIACTGANDCAGMVSLWKSDCPLRPELTPWVASLFVAPRFRGRGIGTVLFAKIRAEAERLTSPPRLARVVALRQAGQSLRAIADAMKAEGFNVSHAGVKKIIHASAR